ncbi:U3 small nucleolar RNA-associated protein 13 [Spathaspora sp. JA1]|nr:U3 small nucleolar RNA-associated protein 13 [Spathaspora sp. JA1]
MATLKTTYKQNNNIEPFYVGGTSCTISADGQFLATPLNEDVIVTNLYTNEIIHKIEGDGELITNVMITPDGKSLAILSQSQQLRIFDVALGTVTKNFKLPSPVYISTVDSTSSLFAFGGSDGVITVWDIESGYVTHSLKGHGTTICSLSFYGELNSTDWKLASGDTMGTVKVWDLVKRKCKYTLKEHNTAVRGVGFDDEGEYFITAGRDNVAVIYSTKNFRPLFTHPINEQIESAGFVRLQHNNRQYFYTAGSENILRIWDIKTGDLVAKSPTPLKTNEELLIIDVIKVQDTSLYLVISDQTIVEVSLQEELLTSKPDHLEFAVVKRIAGNHGIIADIRYVGPEFNLVALATNSPALRVIDPSRPLELKLYEGHTDLLNAIDVSDDGKWIATASKDNEARLWRWNEELEEFESFARFQGHAGAVTAISISKGGSSDVPKFLLTGSSDLTIKKWKIPSSPDYIIKTSEYTRRAHDKDINSIDISPNDEFFATASYDKLAKVWNTDSGETIGILKGHKRGLWDINFYKFDKLIVTASGDKTVKVWSLIDFSCKKTFEGHTNSIQRVKFFNSDSPQLLSAGADGLIKIWDYKSGEVIKSLDNHDNRIWALDLKEDGQEFISADADGKLTEWVDNTAEEILLKEQQDKERIEQEQSLSNFIKNKDWANAFLLALTLDHSMRLYNVIKASIETNEDPDSPIGSKQLEETIVQLNDDQLVKLFKKVRDWNINFKFYELSQKLLAVILNNIAMEKLINIPGLTKIMDSIIPYNERHYARIDDLIEQTYVLDYAVTAEQIRHKKQAKRGISFNILIAGENDLGKKTFINSLCNRISYDLEKFQSENEGISKGFSINSDLFEYSPEGSIPIKLRVFLTHNCGFGLQRDSNPSEIKQFIEEQYRKVLEEEVKVNRNPNLEDTRIHIALYFIRATIKGLSEFEVCMMKAIGARVNLIPVIAKADGLTTKELNIVKEVVIRDIKKHNITIFNFLDGEDIDKTLHHDNPGSDFEISEYEYLSQLQRSMPFAIIGSNTVGSGELIRTNKVGTIDIEDETICDFKLIKNILFGSHLQEFKDITVQKLYEQFRIEELSKTMY